MKIRDRFKDFRSRRTERAGGVKKATPQALDAVFSYQRDGHRWSYEDGHILIDGHDVNPVISAEETTVSTLIGMASGLDDYKHVVEGSTRAGISGANKLIALADALIEKVFGRVKKAYDDKIFGVNWKFKSGELIVNGININSFLALYRVRKTEKARQFLKGLRQKLDSLLSNPSGSMRNEKARAILLNLRREIDEELDKASSAAVSGRLLGSGDPRN